jgi:hypothetical protein
MHIPASHVVELYQMRMRRFNLMVILAAMLSLAVAALLVLNA